LQVDDVLLGKQEVDIEPTGCVGPNDAAHQESKKHNYGKPCDAKGYGNDLRADGFCRHVDGRLVTRDTGSLYAGFPNPAKQGRK
jgi:hypothetical protein